MVFIGPALPPNRELYSEAHEESLLEQQPSAGASARTEPELPQLQMQPPKPGWVGLGLGNMGNSCYLNSVLQCLTYCPPLAHLCRQEHHRKTAQEHPFRHCAYCLLESRIKRSLDPKDGLGGTRAKSIWDNLNVFSKSLTRGEQEDAHEFLRLLLEAVELSCMKHSGQARPQAGKEAYTIVQHIFGGKLQSQVSCLECGHSSTTYDSFCDLSLEITTCSHVDDALARFTAAENLGGANAYNCERCKKLVSARKQITVQEAPNVLVIHLKRFGGPYGLKIGRHVDFSETLSLDGCLSSDSPDRGSFPASSSGHSPDWGRPPANYRLRGVVVHQGSSANSGHYYAYVDVGSSSRPPLWYELNDSFRRKVDSRTVLEDSAYMLFYVREGAKPPRKRAREKAPDCSAPKRVRQESPRQDTPDVADSAHDNNSTGSSATHAGSSRQGSHEDPACSPGRNSFGQPMNRVEVAEQGLGRKTFSQPMNGVEVAEQVPARNTLSKPMMKAEVAGESRGAPRSEPDAIVPDAPAPWVAPKCKVVAEPRLLPLPWDAYRSGKDSGDMEVPDLEPGPSGRAGETLHPKPYGKRGAPGDSAAEGSGVSPVPEWMVKGPGTKSGPARKYSPVTHGKRQLDAGRSKGHAKVYGPNSQRPVGRAPSQSPLGRPIQTPSARPNEVASQAVGSSAASMRGGYHAAGTVPGMRSAGDPRSSRAELAGVNVELMQAGSATSGIGVRIQAGAAIPGVGNEIKAGAASLGNASTCSAGEGLSVRKSAVVGVLGPAQMLFGEAAGTSAADLQPRMQEARQVADGLGQTEAIEEEGLQRVKSTVLSNLRHSSWPNWLKRDLEKSHAKEPGKDAEHFKEELLKKLRPLVPAGIKASAMEYLLSICNS